jgi:deazaflavin-dependent oxidoreductase (nitroreductase family)
VTASARFNERKRRAVTAFHRYVANPVMRRMVRFVPGLVVLETKGRRSGLLRRVPVGGRLDGSSFWLVAEHGRRAGYVRNIEADPRVRVLVRGCWHAGTAHLLPGDDARQRLKRLPAYNGFVVRLQGTDLLTLRIDLDQSSQ